MYENLRLSELLSLLYFYMVSKELELILIFSNEYSKVGMENHRFSTKFTRLALYEKIGIFQQIIRIFLVYFE